MYSTRNITLTLCGHVRAHEVYHNFYSNMAAHNPLDIPPKNLNIVEYFSDPRDWTYRCEGAWTIVVSSTKVRKVLRLRKKECKQSSGLKDEDCVRESLHNLDFMRHVVTPLMGYRYVHIGEVVSIPQDFIFAMTEICRGYRPKHRLNKEIDSSCSVGVVMPDFCFVSNDSLSSPPFKESVGITEAENPTFSVEIKPKCGFLPISPYIDPSRDIKYSVCHYCMLQASKVKEGRYKRKSKYCPLDLFSREPRRVMYSLECLVSDPQNNLRVFCNGKAMFTEELVNEAIQLGKVCCAEMYLEEILQEIDNSDKDVMAVEKCRDGVTTGSYNFGDCVTTNCVKCEEGASADCTKCQDCVNRKYGSCQDNVTTEGCGSAAEGQQDAPIKDVRERKNTPTKESHKCGTVGFLTQRFLGIVLEILISDSRKGTTSLGQVNRLPTSQRCKGSKYSKSKSDIQGIYNFNNFQFGPGGVLKCLLSLQKLDDIDVEGIYELYKKVTRHFECNPGVRDRLGINGPYTSPLWKSVASICMNGTTHSLSQSTSSVSSQTEETSVLYSDFQDSHNLHDAVLRIFKFAVASTAKDSSVMIAFQKIRKKSMSTASMVETRAGDIFHYSVDLVDLEPKEFDRVLKYYNDSKNAVENYLESI